MTLNGQLQTQFYPFAINLKPNYQINNKQNEFKPRHF